MYFGWFNIAKNCVALALFFYAPQASSMIFANGTMFTYQSSRKNYTRDSIKELAILSACFWWQYAKAIQEMSLPDDHCAIIEFNNYIKDLSRNIEVHQSIKLSADALKEINEICMAKKVGSKKMEKWNRLDPHKPLTVVEMECYRQDMINYCLDMERIVKTAAHLD